MKTVRFLITVLGLACAVSLVHAKTLYVGQIAPLSGAASSIGAPLTEGAHAYFNKVNAEGGINGNRIELLDRDDKFLPGQTLAHAKALVAEKPIVALLNVVGAPNNGNLASGGFLKDNGLSVVGAFTGATSVRGLKSPDLYFIRAGVGGEARAVVRQLHTMGITRIGLLRPNDAFGTDAQQQVEAALAGHSLTPVRAMTYEPAGVAVAHAVQELLRAEPQAVVVFGTGSAASQFVVQYRKAGGKALIVVSSATSADVLVSLAGPEHARGVGLVQVVPPITKTTIPVVREYVETLAAHGRKGAKPSTSGLEGFIAAKLLSEAIRRCGNEPTRDAVSRALGRLGQVDLGGLRLDFSGAQREGSSYIQIGILGRDGKLLN